MQNKEFKYQEFKLYEAEVVQQNIYINFLYYYVLFFIKTRAKKKFIL